MAQILQAGSPYPPATFIDFLGMATTGEGYKRPRSYARSLKNGELTGDGKVVKARGYRALSGTWNDNRIHELLQFRRSGVDVLLAYGSNAGGTSAAVAKVTNAWNGSMAFTEIKTGLTANREAVMLQFNTLAYFFDGLNDFCTDGTTTFAIGAAGPVAAAALSTTIAGSLNTSSTYYVAWRWYDSATGRRTNLSPVSAPLTTGATGANAGLRMVIPSETAPTGYDKIQVFCTTAFDVQFFLDQTVSAGTTSIDITAADTIRASGEQDEGATVDSAPYRNHDIAVVANNKIYAGRTDDYGCRTDRSRVSPQIGPLPQSWSPKEFTDCEPNASDTIVGYGVVGQQENQTVIVCKQRSFGKIVKIAEGIEIYQKIADIGCDGHKSIFQFGTMCGWKNSSNIVITDGTTYKEIGGAEDGQAIRDTISSLSQSYRNKHWGLHVPTSKQIRIGCITAGQTWGNIVLMGHYDKLETNGIVKWTTRERGPNASTHPGVQAACAKVVLDDTNIEKTIFGNSAGNGKIYEWDFGTSDDSLGIYAEWEFRPETMGDLQNEKLFTDIMAKVRTGDAATSIAFGVKKDLAGAITILKTAAIGSSGFEFGVARFGITSFSQSPIGHVVVPCQIRATELAFVVRETTNKTMEVLDFTMNAAA